MLPLAVRKFAECSDFKVNYTQKTDSIRFARASPPRPAVRGVGGGVSRAVFRTGIIIIFNILFCLSSFYAQSARAYENAGDDAVEQKDFGAAIQQYGEALKKKTEDVDLVWKYAECARNLHSYPLAEKMYSQLSAGAFKRKKIPPLLGFRLGQVLKNQGKYAEAIAAFEQFISEKPAGVEPGFFDRARVEIESCRWAGRLPSPETAVEVVNAGKGINSAYSDFAPYLSGDTLYFSSYRFDKRGDRKVPRTKLTKVMYSVRNGRAREVSRGFPNTDTAHVAHTAMLGNGHFLFVNLCKNLNAADIRCELYLVIKDIRGRWTDPMRLPEPINLPGYTTTQPSVSYDPASEQLNLWFASDRPGGKGNLDIWYVPLDTNWFCPCNVPVSSRKPPRLPRFDQAVNLSAVNTPENDVTPFFHAPGRTLYFSSEGWRGLGGYDIFKSKLDSAGCSAPENAGPGLNSSYNDLYYVLRPEGKNGYLSSNRPGSQYLDEHNKACCNDIFIVRYPEPPKPEQPLAETPAPTPRVPIERPMIPVERLQEPDPVPTKLADFVGLPLYFDNDEPDKRTRRVKTEKTYVQTAQAYLERQAEYRERFTAGLAGPKRDASEELIDAFFENEVRRGYERLDQLCDMLLTRLQNGEPVEVVIKGFTSPRAESDYNVALGRRRISSVRNHFEEYAGGVLKPYLQSGQFKVSEASFGETTARAGISDDLRDERNSIYHPDAARERRVEIVEIRENR